MSRPALKPTQGKSITTSVPTFAIRFRADDEELEAVYPSPDETDEEAEKQDELESSSQVITASPMAASSASTTVPGVAHSRDPSPMKEYLKGLGKRSTSVDAGVLDPNTSGSDTWRIFHELKGKITKTVEEKLTEMKNERKSSSSVTFLGGSALRGGRMMGGGGSKDDSSISDSESVSESSSKGQEQKSSSLKESDGSPKKVVSNQEDKAIEEDIASSTNSLDLLEVSDTPTLIYSLGSKSSSHTKIKPFQGLRRRKVPKASSNPSSPTSVKMSLLARSDQELEELDVEPGVEAYEDSDIVTLLDTNLDYDIPTTDYRTSPPSSNNVVSTLSRPRRRSFFLRYKVAQKLLILVALLATYFLFQLPTYLSGFLCGVLMTVASYTLFLRLCDILKPTPSMLVDVDVASERFAVPDYSKMPILEIPAAKEFHPINKHAGWMNEYPFNYEPGCYSLTDTRSVYVRLEGSTMRISQTRAKIPKRAMFNEREHNKVKFHHQRIYDISQCRVTLLPEGLTRKRLWSKKYPICIMFDKNCVYKVEYIKEDSTQDTPNSSQDLQDSSSDKGGLVELPDPEVRFQETEDTLHDSADEFHDVTDGEEGDIDDDDEDDDTFCHIDKTALEETCIYLFSRTDREKEEWYRKLVAAVKDRIPAPPNPFNDSSLPCTASTFPRPDEQPTVSAGVSVPDRDTLDQRYLQFMTRFHLKVHRYTGQRLTKAFQTLLLPRSLHDIANHQESSENLHTAPSTQPPALRPSSRRLVKMESEIKLEMENRDVDCDVMWVNVLIGRVLFDILSNPQCVELIRDKIQKKLSTIKLPYFVEELLVTDLELGDAVPMIHRVSSPLLDERGLWVDLDVTYEGSVCLTLETKLNLMKLKEEAGKVVKDEKVQAAAEKSNSAMFDSDLEDTAESSSEMEDEDSSTPEEVDDSPKRKPTGGTSKKIINMVSKIAASKYFQHATENKYIKRAMEGVSNTKIVLGVELKGLVGTLAINISPPPSDRLWSVSKLGTTVQKPDSRNVPYGFRTNPRIWLSARPKLGERQVNIGHLVSWIEKKLIAEFQKKFVYPNMDDLVIPPMSSELPKERIDKFLHIHMFTGKRAELKCGHVTSSKQISENCAGSVMDVWKSSTTKSYHKADPRVVSGWGINDSS
uniref:SMP-LTD domain-containing protein n=1 Tax=Timema cristinae TaxID=61476 RepID=A0A7R9CI70_TIMCR|nr:unnamed protein product [Timema cristinae]